MDERVPHRRRYPRLPSRNSVLVKLLGGEEMEGFVKTRIMGLGGCMFTSDKELGVGSYLDILIALHPTVVKALCKVVYERKIPDSGYEVGVEFIQITDTDRKLLETLWANSPEAFHSDWD